MAAYTHIKNVHPAIKLPPDWMAAGWGANHWGLIGSFTDACRYEITGPDIDGYNKFGGVSFGIDAQDRAIMLGWQAANPFLALAFYWHQGDGGFDFFHHPEMSVVPGERFAWWAIPHYSTQAVACFFQAEMSRQRFLKLVEMPGLDHGQFYRMIHPWFGDKATPPHRMKFYKETVWHWIDDVPADVIDWGNPKIVFV